MSNLPKHLGGHANITHLDVQNLKYLQDKYKIQTMVDIGCGPGGMIRKANSMGIASCGIDGDFTLDFTDISVVLNDFTKSSYKFETTFDLAWSVEFVEHVEEQYIPNFMSVFKQAKYVFMTYSPMECGYHYNVKDSPYWIKVFEDYGFTHDEEETKFIRNNSSMQRNFVRDCGHFFINESYNN
jgi:SAM-dependent methyltransferase